MLLEVKVPLEVSDLKDQKVTKDEMVMVETQDLLEKRVPREIMALVALVDYLLVQPTT